MEAKHIRDLEQKIEYQRTIVLSNDTQLAARDRANRHRIKSLEDQVQYVSLPQRYLLCHELLRLRCVLANSFHIDSE